jgi:hypothetical protein
VVTGLLKTVNSFVPKLIVCYIHPERRSTLPQLRKWCQSPGDPLCPQKAADVVEAHNLQQALKQVREKPDATLLLLDGFSPNGPQLSEYLEEMADPKPFNVVFNDPEWETPVLNAASASLLCPVHAVTTDETLYATLRKALLRVRTQQLVRPSLLTTAQELQAFFELRYQVWTELNYLDQRKVCPETPWELDYTDRTSLPFGLFSRSNGKLLGGGRLVRDYGMEDPMLVKTIEGMLRDRAANALINNFAYPRTISHPFDILGELQGFQSYYRNLVHDQISKAEVSRIVVNSQDQKRGFGEVIVDTLCALGESHGMQRLFLACHEKHREFYGRSGFRAVAGVAGDKFLTYNVPCIAMERSLCDSRRVVADV